MIELQVRKEINELLEQRAEQKKHLNYIEHLLKISKWLTCGLYLAFTLSLYLGDILHIQTLISSFLGSMPGFIFYLIICLALAYVLAGIKHAAYSHFSMFGATAGIVVVVIGMGLIAEVFQSSGNQDTKARAIAENNPEYQNIVNTKPGDNIRIDAGLSVMIAAAEQKLARCEERRARGKEKHCKGDLAKLNSYKASQDTLMTKQTQVAQSATQTQFARIDKIINDSYNPVIRSISSMLETNIASAISLIMFVIAICFEILHYFLSSMRAKTLDAIRRLNDGIRALEIQYYNVAGVEFDGTAHTAPLDLSDTKSAGWKPFGNPLMTASAAPIATSFKYQSTAPAAKKPTPTTEKPFGFINTNTINKGQTTSAQHPNYHHTASDKKPILGKAETQLDIPEISTYSAELAEHNIHSPADKAMEQTANKTAIERIIAKGQQTAEDPALPCAQGHAGSTTQGQSDKATQGKEAVAKMPPNLYEQWKTAIESEEVPRTSTASRKWIQQKIAGSQTAKATPTLKEITLVSNAFYLRACSSSDSRINIKPGYKNGQKEKYILTDAPCVLTA